jgi:hypothetical protein
MVFFGLTSRSTGEADTHFLLDSFFARFLVLLLYFLLPCKSRLGISFVCFCFFYTLNLDLINQLVTIFRRLGIWWDTCLTFHDIKEVKRKINKIKNHIGNINIFHICFLTTNEVLRWPCFKKVSHYYECPATLDVCYFRHSMVSRSSFPKFHVLCKSQALLRLNLDCFFCFYMI